MTTIRKRLGDTLRRYRAPLLVILTIVLLFAGIVWFANANATIMIEYVNPSLWVVSNLTILYASVALIVWCALYGFRFRWNTTPAGTDVFWFTMALLGLVMLSIVGIFVNPRQPWYQPPPDLLVWRPFLRYLVYTGIAITLTRMDWSLIQRLRGRQPLLFEVVPRDREPR